MIHKTRYNMNRKTELELIARCLDLQNSKSTTLSDDESVHSTNAYHCDKRFVHESQSLLKRLPFPVMHSSELAEPNSLLPVQTPLGHLIMSRDGEGRIHAFHNICRHRGAALFSKKEIGQIRRKKLISCPYHAWAYSTNGELVAIPDQQHCFPDIDRQNHSLLEVPTLEQHGFVWLVPSASNGDTSAADLLSNHLDQLSPSLDWLQLDQFSVFKRHTRIWKTNWKLLLEGGLESYHFSYAHKSTIAGDFLNNVAVTDKLGSHIRMVMPTSNLKGYGEVPEQKRRLLDCAHIVYAFLPNTVLLVQHEHIDWISFRPSAPNQTEISIATLVPTNRLNAQEHWQRNHDITVTVLDEDFEIAEGIQQSIDSGALSEIIYGRNEWALAEINQTIDKHLADADSR